MNDHVCTISTDWSYRGFQALVMENPLLRTVILPELGAKIQELVYKPVDRDFLYHHPRNPPRAPVYGVNMDDWWSGGVDEAIPTGHRCSYKGEEYPVIGEVWSQPWSWDVVASSGDQVEVHLTCQTIIAPLRVERWHWLEPGESVLHSRHKVTNVGLRPCEFIWGIHPTFALTPDCRIDLPAGKVWVAESSPDWHLGARGSTYLWPYARTNTREVVDMRQVQPPEAGWHELHHAIELKEGWLALTDVARQEGVVFSFSSEVFDTVWLWLVYGGWRDLYAAGLEAWTGYPAKLSEAVEFGRFARLEPGETLEASSRFTCFQGLKGVRTVRSTGEVVGLDAEDT